MTLTRPARAIAAALASLIGAASAAGPEPAAAPQRSLKLDVGRFRPVEGPTAPPQVYYKVVEEDGQPMLRGTYHPDADTVVMGIEIPDEVKPRARLLTWRWRARAFPNGGDECRPGFGDSVASVQVAFKSGLRWYVLRYVWSPAGRLGAVCDRKRTLFLVRDTIVLESGGAPGTWLNELVDVRQAFIDHFANGDRNAHVPDMVGIGVLTDGDQTHSESGADWADFDVQY